MLRVNSVISYHIHDVKLDTHGRRAFGYAVPASVRNLIVVLAKMMQVTAYREELPGSTLSHTSLEQVCLIVVRLVDIGFVFK